jgi:hypothetical protein
MIRWNLSLQLALQTVAQLWVTENAASATTRSFTYTHRA